MLGTFVSHVTPQDCLLIYMLSDCAAVAALPTYMSERCQPVRCSQIVEHLELYSKGSGFDPWLGHFALSCLYS